jgi:DNA-binding MarR family transcriptional regulator
MRFCTSSNPDANNFGNCWESINTVNASPAIACKPGANECQVTWTNHTGVQGHQICWQKGQFVLGTFHLTGNITCNSNNTNVSTTIAFGADRYVLGWRGSDAQVIQRELAQRLEVEGPTLVRRLDQLEAAGLVLRSDSPSDRRATRVALTDAGRALFKRVRSSVSNTESEVVRELQPGDVQTTLRVLRHLITKSRQLTKGR